MSELVENPYAAPAATAATAPPEVGRGTIHFEEYETQVVRTMIKGMRVTGALEIAVAALIVILIGGAMLVASKMALIWSGASVTRILGGPAIVVCAIAVVIGLAAIWLLQSSGGFMSSLRDQRTDGLAVGFHKLRLYLIVTGVFMALNLLLSLFGVFALSMTWRLG